MSITLHEAAVPGVVQTLKGLAIVLDKARADAEARQYEPAVLLGTRLAPDMFSLARQVQVASDFANAMVARLAGHDVPKNPDTETTIDELKARIAKTIAFVEGVAADAIDQGSAREITLKIGGNPVTFTGRDYLVRFALPNFYFHATAAYAILRHCGVKIGKRDYLGAS